MTQHTACGHIHNKSANIRGISVAPLSRTTAKQSRAANRLPMIAVAVLAAIASTMNAVSAVGEESWTQFRGTSGTGVVAADASIPESWSLDKNLAWKAAIPGTGWSQPVVWGDKLFVTLVDSKKLKKPVGMGAGTRDFSMLFGNKAPDAVLEWQVACLNLKTGDELWRKTAKAAKPTIPIHASNTYATETPVADAENVYTWFAPAGLVACFSHKGDQLWTRELGVKKMAADFGTGSSPTLVNGKLIIQFDNEEESFLVALDCKTGEDAWRTPRKEKTSWATPLVWTNTVRTEIVCAGSGNVTGYDPATGKVLWTVGGIQSSFSASPVGNADMLFFGNSGPTSNGPLYGVRAGASGDITLADGKKSNDFVVWTRTRSGPGMASPVVAGDYLYVVASSVLGCYSVKTGEKVYTQRLPGGKTVVSSPLAVGDKLMMLNEEGEMYTIAVGPEFKLLSTNSIPDLFWSSPAVAGNSLLLRGVEYLYCIREQVSAAK